MAKVDVWATVAAERKALADDLSSLTDAQWDTQSLCDEWTVRDVLAHMTSTAKISPAAFFPKLISSGFSLKKVQAKDIARERGASPAETLANFKSILDSRKSPPGPKDTWLGEVVVHSSDIRRPLGIDHQFPTDAAVQVADFFKGSNLIIGAKKRIAGLQLRATDADWSTGDGPEVAGPIASLVMAMTGRKAAIADLKGEGVAQLQSRS
ncbi:MAG: maleylpyruvate isomerase family mycothiol-dependent enzyme [Actinobacteria bacterium]|nr:maleylpyruvate isomerase family mycothiol-dependent enzyme [Actinomycetota bacterium]MBV9662735.1 maleylpyruvate isomerase family mycothiol-dependent enzyme [Actinomycetota bacterium]MBV9934887.1 maleylpyruvate isomerase family mycothiol-dependent enzyme [Actinomycetota bacterium]